MSVRGGKSSDTATWDLSSATELQKKIHFVKNEEEVYSSYNNERVKVSWSTTTKESMSQQKIDESFKFDINKKHDYLISTSIHQNIPKLILTEEAINDGIEICWPHNFGHVMIKSASFNIDDKSFSFESSYLDCYSQFMMKDKIGFEMMYDKMVGNVPELEAWNTRLPATTLRIPQPWFYSWGDPWAFPICKSQDTDLSHVYTTERIVFDILRMRRKLEDGSYEFLYPESSLFVNVKEETPSFDSPSLIAKYGKVNTGDREHQQKNSSPVVFGIDTVHVESTNTEHYGKTANLILEERNPCIALFCMAKEKCTNNNPSNYTTNSQNVYSGFSPISKIELVHGSTTRFPKTESEFFSYDEVWENFPSARRENGYFAMCFTKDIGQPEVSISRSLGSQNSKLYVTLSNTDPSEQFRERSKRLKSDSSGRKKYQTLEETNVRKDTREFHVQTVLMIIREIQFSRNENGIMTKCRIVE